MRTPWIKHHDFIRVFDSTWPWNFPTRRALVSSYTLKELKDCFLNNFSLIHDAKQRLIFDFQTPVRTNDRFAWMLPMRHRMQVTVQFWRLLKTIWSKFGISNIRCSQWILTQVIAWNIWKRSSLKETAENFCRWWVVIHMIPHSVNESFLSFEWYDQQLRHQVI